MSITAVSALPEPHALADELGRALPYFASVDWQASVASTNQSLMAQVRQSNQAMTRVGHDYWVLTIKQPVVGERGGLGKIRADKH